MRITLYVITNYVSFFQKLLAADEDADKVILNEIDVLVSNFISLNL